MKFRPEGDRVLLNFSIHSILKAGICMEDIYLYHQIAESIRQDILEGSLKAGERLPSVRELTGKWGCTGGTVQRAYQDLARQGLVNSRPGRGTFVSMSTTEAQSQLPLRRAALVNRAEAFLLEVFSAGYSQGEVQRALDLAVDRWRSFEFKPEPEKDQTLQICGSHDLVLAWLVSHSRDIFPGISFDVSFVGSLGGLIALAEGKADMAACHLWDEETQTYNKPFIRRMLPSRPAVIIHLAVRRLGLILPPGNPQKIQKLADLTQTEVVFANRQSGSGTRVWLDARLGELGIGSEQIRGYDQEHLTHSEVARAVACGKATVGLGLEASARSFGLDFILLTRESFDLVCLEKSLEKPAVIALTGWLRTDAGKAVVGQFDGYENDLSGMIERV